MNPRLQNGRRLLGKARDDAYILTRLADDPAAPDWPLGFHAQQAVEKALKAVLTAHEVEYPPTHNLAMLVAKLAEQDIDPPPEAEGLSRLTPFSVALRYDDMGEPQEVDLDRASVVACVEHTLAWAEDALSAIG